MATLDADDLAAIANLFTAGTMQMALKRLAIANDTADPAFHVTNSAGDAAFFAATGPVDGHGAGLHLAGHGAGPSGSALYCEGGMVGDGATFVGGTTSGHGAVFNAYGEGCGINAYGTGPDQAAVLMSSDAGAAGVGVLVYDGDGPGLRMTTAASHGIAITSAGAGNRDVALLGSGDVLGSISIDLTQPLSDVCAATVGGALNGAHATAWGKVVKDVAAKLLKVFSFGSTAVPMATFGLDDGSNPTTRTPQ